MPTSTKNNIPTLNLSYPKIQPLNIPTITMSRDMINKILLHYYTTIIKTTSTRDILKMPMNLMSLNNGSDPVGISTDTDIVNTTKTLQANLENALKAYFNKNNIPVPT